MEHNSEYKKTNIMIFTNRKFDYNGNVYYGQDKIIIVETFVYLGIKLNHRNKRYIKSGYKGQVWFKEDI